MAQVLTINHIRYLLENHLSKFLPPSGKYVSYARNISILIMYNFGDNVERVLGIPHDTENVKLSILRYNLAKDELLVRYPLKKERHKHNKNPENYWCKQISVNKLIVSPKTKEEIINSLKDEIVSLTNKANMINKEIAERINELLKYEKEMQL